MFVLFAAGAGICLTHLSWSSLRPWSSPGLAELEQSVPPPSNVFGLIAANHGRAPKPQFRFGRCPYRGACDPPCARVTLRRARNSAWTVDFAQTSAANGHVSQ